MARMTINIDMDSAAFDWGDREAELCRILRNLADRMEHGICEVSKIYDINGNRIGQAEFFEKW